ncbi:hypothetical protein WMY93_002449 [Mugilogobius chulae]|uniref:Uncharacterized protein n=1 Tax=Mugilogobius chulae TaxID=88201 RepID=A0AAW0PTK7_9GOBI
MLLRCLRTLSLLCVLSLSSAVLHRVLKETLQKDLDFYRQKYHQLKEAYDATLLDKATQKSENLDRVKSLKALLSDEDVTEQMKRFHQDSELTFDLKMKRFHQDSELTFDLKMNELQDKLQAFHKLIQSLQKQMDSLEKSEDELLRLQLQIWVFSPGLGLGLNFSLDFSSSAFGFLTQRWMMSLLRTLSLLCLLGVSLGVLEQYFSKTHEHGRSAAVSRHYKEQLEDLMSRRAESKVLNQQRLQQMREDLKDVFPAALDVLSSLGTFQDESDRYLDQLVEEQQQQLRQMERALREFHDGPFSSSKRITTTTVPSAAANACNTSGTTTTVPSAAANACNTRGITLTGSEEPPRLSSPQQTRVTPAELPRLSLQQQQTHVCVCDRDVRGCVCVKVCVCDRDVRGDVRGCVCVKVCVCDRDKHQCVCLSLSSGRVCEESVCRSQRREEREERERKRTERGEREKKEKKERERGEREKGEREREKRKKERRKRERRKQERERERKKRERERKREEREKDREEREKKERQTGREEREKEREREKRERERRKRGRKIERGERERKEREREKRGK